MKEQMLKISGHKNTRDFYAEFPDEVSFMKKHGKEFNKARLGKRLEKAQVGVNMTPQNAVGVQDYYSENNPYFTTNPGPKKQQGFEPIPPVKNELEGLGKAASKIDVLGISGKLISGIGAIKMQKEVKNRARQSKEVSDINLKAVESLDVDAQRMAESSRAKQRELELPVNTGEEFFPIYGNGKEVLAKQGTKLKNYRTKAFGGVELDAVKSVEKINPWSSAGQIGTGIASQLTDNNAGGQIGGSLGKAAGTIFGGPIGGAIGEFAGTALGGLLDTSGKKTKRYNEQAFANMQKIAGIGATKGIQKQYGSYMENGGALSNYGEDDYDDNGDALDGQLETQWGGELESLSYNPYLPNSGETAMFRGASHDNGGIGATYSGNSVEAEGGEPVVELPDNDGGNSAVIFGNLKINKDNALLLGDKKATNKKFKSYISDLSKQEERSNKTIEKSMQEFEEFKPITSFDKLKSNTLQLNVKGADMRLKSIAHKKKAASELQSSINDTAREYGLSAEHLALGKYKKATNSELAEFGTSLHKAQSGARISQIDRELGNLEDNPAVRDVTPTYTPYSEDYMSGSSQVNRELDYLEDAAVTNPTNTRYSEDTVSKDGPRKLGKILSKENIDKAMTAYNQVLPFIRKSDAEALDLNQLQGEYNALANNDIDPVYARGYSPQHDVPYEVSLQDMRNENRASTRSAERMLGYNPAAASMLASEAYGANQKIGAEEFRINQGRKDKAYSDNRARENDAQLKNLGIYDQQYVRQAQAKSNTKAITQAALNSISNKFAQNKLENRKLQTYENLYKYRFDKNYRAINNNEIPIFNTQGNTHGEETKSEEEQIADMEDKIYEHKAKKREQRKAPKKYNGGIIQSLKRL